MPSGRPSGLLSSDLASLPSLFLCPLRVGGGGLHSRFGSGRDWHAVILRAGSTQLLQSICRQRGTLPNVPFIVPFCRALTHPSRHPSYVVLRSCFSSFLTSLALPSKRAPTRGARLAGRATQQRTRDIDGRNRVDVRSMMMSFPAPVRFVEH